ncbi:MAG: hypothetical protein WCT19_02785, partial [Candidatus Paceibacterota bacterium]
QKYVETWCEKAVAISQITKKYDINLFAGGGYRSGSSLHKAAERFKYTGKPGVILYLGDFDPSGLDIERDIETRMKEIFDIEIDVQRVLLTRQDIIDYELLPSPVKSTDTRTSGYIEKNDLEDAYELDALLPDVLAEKLEEAIRRNIDIELYETQLKKWEEDDAKIAKFIKAWNKQMSHLD